MKIVDVIKYEGDNKTFIWKHKSEDFNTLSQLVVHESQEALLFLGGQALDLFGPGTHTLHTKNIPLLNKIINLPTGGVSPFHCEVYFINKTEQTNIKWGMGDVNYLDPKNNDYAFTIGAHGTMNLRVSDARKVVIKLVGTEGVFNEENVKENFKTPINNLVKTMLPNLLREKNLSIYEVETCLEDISNILKLRISKEMADYGISLEKFWIEEIKKPENDLTYIDLNRQRGEKIRLKNQGELDIERAGFQKEVDIINYSGKVQKDKMDIDIQSYKQKALGYTYKEERQFDVMDKMAGNEGNGAGVSNALIGMGMGVSMAGAVGETFRNISKDTILSGTPERKAADVPQPVPEKTKPSVDSWTCSCGAVNSGNFCPKCGAKKPSEDWICSCGAVNSENFCPDCGKPRPEN